MPSLTAKLAKKFTMTPGCWIWTAAKADGYGRIGIDGRTLLAHRVVYELLVGPIPPGLDLDHTCHNGTGCPGGPTCPHRACVNPLHLEPVTRQTNLLRGPTVVAAHARKTHCPKGHPYSGANLYVDKTGSRHCKRCMSDTGAARRARLNA